MVNLDDVVEGPKIAVWETVVEFDLGHDDYSVWQVQHFGCLGLIFRGRITKLAIPRATLGHISYCISIGTMNTLR